MKYEEELTKLKTSWDLLNQKNKELEELLKIKTENFNKLTEELQKLKIEIENLSKKNISLVDDNFKLKQDNESLKENKLEDKIEEGIKNEVEKKINEYTILCEKEKLDLQNIIDKLHKIITNNTNNTESITKYNVELKQLNDKYTIELDNLKKQNIKLNFDKLQLSTKLSKLQKSIDLIKDNDKLNNENKLKLKLEFETELARIQSILNNKEIEISKLLKTIEQLKEQETINKSQNIQVNTSNVNNLLKYEIQVIEKKKELEKCQKELLECNNKLKEYNKKLNDCLSEKKKLEILNKEIDKKYNSLNIKFNQLKTAFDILKHNNDVLSKDYTKLINTMKNDIKSNIDEIIIENKELEDLFNKLYSNSYIKQNSEILSILKFILSKIQKYKKSYEDNLYNLKNINDSLNNELTKCKISNETCEKLNKEFEIKLNKNTTIIDTLTNEKKELELKLIEAEKLINNLKGSASSSLTSTSASSSVSSTSASSTPIIKNYKTKDSLPNIIEDNSSYIINYINRSTNKIIDKSNQNTLYKTKYDLQYNNQNSQLNNNQNSQLNNNQNKDPFTKFITNN